MEAASVPQGSTALLLGELLVRAGNATQEQINQALELQPLLHKRLGEILVEKRWTTPRAVAEALAQQYGLEFVDLTQVAVDPQATSLLQEGFAIGHQVLPVRFLDDNHVQVAVADPTNLHTTDELRLALGVNCTLAVAASDALASTIQRNYRLTIAVTDRAPEIEQVDDDSMADGALDLVNDLIGRGVNAGASDIHLNPQPREVMVRFRVDGVLRDEAPIDKRLQSATAARVKVMAQLDIAEKRLPQDGSFVVYIGGNAVDVRAAILPTKHGEQVVLRVQRETKLELPQLGMSPEMEGIFMRAIEQPHGAVISCGPTGSGKTTTLYAALDRLNDGYRSIATIEDPVEYQLPGVMQMEVHTKIGLSFGRGLRTILRADPEVILVGEIRDEETAKIAIQAAMTGHLVLTTLHTNDAASAIARMRTLGVDPDLLAGSINCIVSQRLARRVCGHCREPYEPSQEQQSAMNLIPTSGSKPTLYRANGCLQCGNTGYAGRFALYELMPVHGLGRVLLDGSTDEIFDAAVAAGMRTLREDGVRQSLAGVTTLEEVRRITGDRRLLA
ncbi:MAG TPA: ATPase, T2SS/T4P/T4SS family [Gaiellaceae bacterium]|nr:ATPase, T2SS/T4P/T4SS family [Gaiellaceae bacterium]